MLEALEAHQRAFLQEALPTPFASTSAAGYKKKESGKGKVAEKKSVWDMGMDDFDDEEAGTDEDSDEEDDEDEEGEEGELDYFLVA